MGSRKINYLVSIVGIKPLVLQGPGFKTKVTKERNADTNRVGDILICNRLEY